MTTVVQISDYRVGQANRRRRGTPDLWFDRHELDLILSVYSDRVINGEWRDYAIRHEASTAAFQIYCSSSQRPAVTVAKHRLAGGKTEFVVYDGAGRPVSRSVALRDALAVLRRRFRLVSN